MDDILSLDSLIGGSFKPMNMVVSLGFLRSLDYFTLREDIIGLLNASIQLPNNTAIAITPSSCIVMTDEEERVLGF